MNKIVDFEGIGYVAATLPVDTTTQAYLKANYTESTTGNVDINGKQLAVKLNSDGTVGFGTATASDVLFGVIVAYEMDGFATVQVKGGLDNVPTAAAIPSGNKELVVAATGAIAVVAGGRSTDVVKPSSSESLYASIIL